MKSGNMSAGNLKCFLLVVVFGVLSLSCSLQAQDMKNHKMNDSTMMKRHHMIHKNSSKVMPFDMDKVTHYFIKTGDGGNLSLKVKNPKDTAQVA